MCIWVACECGAVGLVEHVVRVRMTELWRTDEALCETWEGTRVEVIQ
jgi:hypothetical protein